MGAEEQFMAALVNMLDSGDIRQVDIAERTGTAPQTINAMIKRNKAPGLQKQEQIADACGFAYTDFLEKGQSILSGKARASLSTDYKNPNDILPAVASWVSHFQNQFQEVKDKLGFWRTVFDSLPVACLVIKDRIVIYQNHKSLMLGRIVGSAICENCASKECQDKGNCPVTIAVKSGIAASGYRDFGGVIYKVEVEPFWLNEREHFIVTATERIEDTSKVLVKNSTGEMT